MSYRNPGQIQADRSGEIYGRALAGFGAQMLSFAQNFAAAREKAAKEQKAENDRIQRIGYEVEEAAYNEANSNYVELQKKDPGLAEQFKTQTEVLLNGVGNVGDADYKIGAIKAQTILKTQGDLTKKQRAEYRKVVQDAKAFQDRMLAGGTEIIADLADMEKIKPQDIGNTYFYVGNTVQERLTSQFSAYVLGNKNIPGATTSKNLRSDENGIPIISVNTVFDVESDAGKKLLNDFPELQPQIKDGKISFNWERSIDKLGDGFIREIPEGVDATSAFEDSGAMKDGRLTQKMMVGQPTSKRLASGAEGRDNLVTTQFINTAGLESDPTFNAQVEAKIEGLISMDPGDVRAYMQNTLKLGSKYDYDSFLKLSSDEKKKILTRLEKDKVIETKLSGFSSRIATKEDAAYINENAESLSGEGSATTVIPGETKVYFTEKVSQISSITPTTISVDDKNVMSEETWESYKESGYQPSGTFRFDWDPVRKAFVQMKLTVSDGAVVAQETGQIARSPQELGNLTGQTIKNYQGFEIQDPMRPTTGEARERELQEEIFSGVNIQ